MSAAIVIDDHVGVCTPRPKRCGHCQQEFWGAVHDCFPAEELREPSDVAGRL